MADKRFIKGLFKDTAHIDQPDGTWRHARNMVFNETDGAISNEGGTSLGGHLGTNPERGAQEDKVIGKIEIDDNRVVLFIVNVVESLSGTGNPPRSEIGIWQKDKYFPIFNPALGTAGNPTLWITNDLGFTEDNPIEGTFKIDSKGDLLIYWTDDKNPPRAFNIDRQLRESGDGTLANVNVNMMYGLGPAQIEHINMLNLFPYSGSIPHIDIDDQGSHQNCVVEGGGLLTAVYYLALAYVDDDLVATNFLTVASPVPIVEESDATNPTNKKDGAKQGSQTTKAIKWEISNLNRNYKYLRPVVIRSMGGAKEAFRLNDVTFTTTTTTIIFSGLETTATGSLEEVIVDTVAYDTAKTMQQLDNVLYLGNTTGSKDLGYQKYANNIKLRSRVDLIEDFDTFYASVDNLETGWGTREVNEFGGAVQTVDPTKSYRYVPNIFKYKGYMRDEIYAFYIAFILNDGSMSYAYHIPGREFYYEREIEPVTTLNINYGNLWEDIHKISPEFSKLFHWMDTYTWNISQGAYDLAATMGMNYWQNATEFYPNTLNYEVWDEDTYVDATGVTQNLVGDLRNTNVRHHHFPSNRHKDRKTITEDKLCRTVNSTGSDTTLTPWVGKIAMLDITNGKHDSEDWYACCSNWTRNKFRGSPAQATALCGSWGQASGGYTNDPAMQAALWNNTTSKFTADQEMQVNVRWFVVHRQKTSNDPNGDVCTRLRKIVGGVASTVNSDCDAPNIIWNGCGHGGSNCGSGLLGDNWIGWNAQTWSGQFTLNAGDQVYLESQKETTNGSSMYQCGYDYYAQNCVVSPGNWGFSFIEFDVVSAGGQVLLKDLHDAKINHNVRRLGFNLEDIKIPQSIADKVQGFRIYYANRSHADRTVLGQSVLIPSQFKKEILGICSEASSSVNEASQILSTLQANPEEFYNVDAWARYWGNYPVMTFNQEDGGPSAPVSVNYDSAMTIFSFHDFYMLRTKNSLAGATHINIEYYVRNLAWNGPGLDQDKKMVTILSPGKDASGNVDNDLPLTVKEIWGWDSNQNCYPQKMKAAFFAGVEYITPSSRTQPRLLGQKAKTYLLGDTIFQGKDLGFGGKLFNEFGESCIIFGLMDNHAIGAYKVRSYPASAQIGYFADTYGQGSTEAHTFGAYNLAHGGNSILVNTLDASGDWTNTPGSPSSPWHGQRSQSVMANLKAFKTDVYKSIDSQELVWTGFEVLEDDLDNYVFDNSGMLGTGNTFTTHPEGIYGGDTFICRYGVSTALKHSNSSQTAEPEKAVHFHIVESTDNINYRHVEDDNSLYFPNSVLKDIVRNAGTKDFNHVDNLRYNHNYSELNDVRPAFPLPLRDNIQDDFPTRTHRSVKHDPTSLIDNYRIFLANQFKDLPKNRGDLWKLSTFNNLLYFHMEESLFAAQGKQTMSMKDGSEAFVGSGDIFAQEPNEMIQTQDGFGGTQSQYASLTTRYGYFFVDVKSRKVFLMQDKLNEISNLGMENWFKDNIPFALENYKWSSKCNMDNPIKGMGLHAIYDPKFKRIILSKREFVPTDVFQDGWDKPSGPGTAPCSSHVLHKIRFNSALCRYERWGPNKFGVCTWTEIYWSCKGGFFECKGWTVSYYPEYGVWASFHDYIPYIYFNTSTDFYSLTDQYLRPVWESGVTTLATHAGTTFGNAGIWKHNSKEYKGIYYQEWQPGIGTNINETAWRSIITYYPFEFEFVHNEFKTDDTLLHSFNYTLETFNDAGISVLEHGFTSYFIYNTFQLSGIGQDFLDLEGNNQADYNGTVLDETDISTLEYFINIRRVGNNWKTNKFRDMAATVGTQGFLNEPNVDPYYMGGGNVNIIGGGNTGTLTTSHVDNMFIYEGMYKIVNARYLDLGKNWTLQRKFIDKWVGIRLIYNNITNNLLNLYSTNVAVRKMHR